MLANLPVEIILLICQYPEFKDLGQLAWTNKRMMRIIKKYLPKALEIEFERKILFYRRKIFLVWTKIIFLVPYINGKSWERRIFLFDSRTSSIEQIARFTNHLLPYEVITTKYKVDFFIWNYSVGQKYWSVRIFTIKLIKLRRFQKLFFSECTTGRVEYGNIQFTPRHLHFWREIIELKFWPGQKYWSISLFD